MSGIFDALLPEANHLILMQAIHPRAMSPNVLAQMARDASYTGPLEQIPDAIQALERASQLAGQDGIIVVTGSLFTAGEIRDLCDLEPGHAVYHYSATIQQLRAR